MIALNSPDALKESFKTTLLELECDQTENTIKILNQINGVEEITPHGVLLHISVIDKKVKKEIRNTLLKNKIHLQRLEEILPTLEDIFISMVNSQDNKKTLEGIQ
jgi:ABC-2 type transport system ATP-binding protein